MGRNAGKNPNPVTVDIHEAALITHRTIRVIEGAVVSTFLKMKCADGDWPAGSKSRDTNVGLKDCALFASFPSTQDRAIPLMATTQGRRTGARTVTASSKVPPTSTSAPDSQSTSERLRSIPKPGRGTR